MQTRKLRGAIAALSLALCSACSANKVQVQSLPPPEWTEPVAEPAVPAGNSDREVGGYIISLKDALDRANNRLRRLRDWANGLKD